MRKIFYEDINITEFDGKVMACEYDEARKLYKVLLDATAFFPEEGGQSADIGSLGGQRVMDVQIKDDLIYHYVENAMEVGTTVTSQVDWNQRFDFMQQHSGEHILSGLIHNKFGYNNVGFHLSNNEVTMDFNGTLTWEQARDIELEANRIVYQNLPVEILYPSAEELANMEYRSKIEIDGQVRIVAIPGVDMCACCAPHVATTGQIGIIKIVSVQSYKGGVRLSILCGERALRDYNAKFDSVSAIAQDMSTKQEQVVESYQRLKDECQTFKLRVNELQAKCLNMSLAALPSPKESENAVLFTDITDNMAIRNAVNELMERYSGYCAVFGGSDGAGGDGAGGNGVGSGSYRFVAGSKSLDCSELAQKLRNELGAKCGGNKLMIQGSVEGSKDRIIEVI
ncbi:MAG: alanyl-tRNA editing protein [Lachnospiraceae bacterium]|nr:alanyl-tRNA editing protein [Lachnospiraceae bacterium]